MASDDKDFQQLSDLPGKLYVPRSHGEKKHPCPECFECQWCADARCAACRGWCGRCREEGGGEGGTDPEGRKAAGKP